MGALLGFLDRAMQSLPTWLAAWAAALAVVVFVAQQFWAGAWRISERNRKQDEMTEKLEKLESKVGTIDEMQDAHALSIGLLTQQGARTEEQLDTIYKAVLAIPQQIAKGRNH
jgi:hypothetical protein